MAEWRLEIGNSTETVTVTAEAVAIQLASSEKSTLVDGIQLSNVTLKGRDIFGYLKLLPGVVDISYNGTNAGNRDVTSPNAIRGITINGNTSALNFTVDGITDMDTGSNSTLHYEPNADAVQEMKVLGSNYQAEFGRNSGGTITVVTKNGTQDFHGSLVWNHRNEEFNANQWENNRNGRNAVRTSRVSHSAATAITWKPTPSAAPSTFRNTSTPRKNKLFFFWSQEYTGQFVSGGVQNKYTPTALERQGDFSQSCRTTAPCSPSSTPPTAMRLSPATPSPPTASPPVGQACSNFFPLPNFAGTGSQRQHRELF